jgi:Fe-S-cluster-containing hydrogenase component 2
MAILHQAGGGPDGSPPVDALCPFGGLETLYKYLAGGEFLKRTNLSNFVLLAGTVITGIVFGRYFCGWICMLGWLQEIPARIGKRIFRKRFVIPQPADRILRYLKYPVLVLILIFTWRMADLVIRPFDPFAAYAHLPAGIVEVLQEFLIGFIILVGSMILSMFYDRFFCKYLCPMGAFLGILQKISLFRIKRDRSTCIDCGRCSRACPVNIPVAQIETVNSSECIACQECVHTCPTGRNTMQTHILGRPVKPLIIGISGLALYGLIILAANFAGLWKTQAKTFTEVVQEDGALNPENIRGFMTLREIAATFQISLEDLYRESGLDESIVGPDTRMKEIGDRVPDYEEDQIRDAVKRILEKEGRLKSSLEENKESDGTQRNTSVPDPSEIRGTMTLQELLTVYQISKSDLFNAIGYQGDLKGDQTLKDLKAQMQKTDPSFEVENIREAVKNLIRSSD